MRKEFLINETGLELSEYARAVALVVAIVAVTYQLLSNAMAARLETLAQQMAGTPGASALAMKSQAYV